MKKHAATVNTLSTRATLALLVGAICGINACDSALTKPSLYNTVEVITTRRNGEPVSGVSLELYTGQRPMGYGTSDSTGHFVFTRVPQGNYGVTATAWPVGYDLLENLIGGAPTNVASGLAVANNTLAPVRFTLLKKGPGLITLRVGDARGPALSGTLVKLYSPQAVIATAVTDSLGRVTFSNVPYGQYGLVATRPYYYRDYVTPGDSAFSYRDGLVVEEGSRDSVAMNFNKCIGAVRVTVRDETEAPVPASTAALYSSVEGLGVQQTGADGSTVFVAPCAFSLGVAINPAPAFIAPEGRGSSFVDGLVVRKSGDTLNAVLHVRRR